MHSIDPSRVVNIFTVAIVITSVWNSTITASTIISAVTMTNITITTTSPSPTSTTSTTATRSSSRSSWSNSRAGVSLTASAGTAWPTWTPRSAEAVWAHGRRAGREAARAAASHFQIGEKNKRYFSNLSSEETAWGSVGSFLRDVHVGLAPRPILALCDLAQQHLWTWGPNTGFTASTLYIPRWDSFRHLSNKSEYVKNTGENQVSKHEWFECTNISLSSFSLAQWFAGLRMQLIKVHFHRTSTLI